MKANRKPPRIFADIADGNVQGPQMWREFKNEEARQKADSGNNLNQNAIVGFKNKRVLVITFTLQSPSRDWAHFITYYFREDGSLAKIDAQLNTFYGHLSVFRERFYSAQGKLLGSREKFISLSSQQETKPTGDFIDEPIPLYKNVRDLPFFKLL